MMLLALVDENTTATSAPLTVALIFGLAGTFYLGIYFIHRIRRRNAILKRHLRAEAYRAPKATDADRPAPKPYQGKKLPIIPNAPPPPRGKRIPAKRPTPRPYKCRQQLPLSRKALPPPKVEPPISGAGFRPDLEPVEPAIQHSVG